MTCLKYILSYNFEKVAIIYTVIFSKGCATKYEVQGANNFVQSIFGVLCGMIADLAFFPQIFCFSNANKINKHVNTKAFVIATIFWEKWCII